MTFPMHPDDMPSPRFGGWADDFNTYTEACEYYGADAPDMLLAEQAEELAQARIEWQDEIEINGPRFGRFGYASAAIDDDCPF